jgi:HAD superfamily hydrolase (TIGR01509 family)
MIRAAIFDLDGVILDSERIWERARREVTAAAGVAYPPEATRAIMGMSAPEWSAYMRDALGIPLPAERIDHEVASRVAAAYRRALPLFPGAVDAVRRLAARLPLAIASSSNRSLIELAIDAAGLRAAFAAVVSAEEVGRGKPAPDVYLRAAALVGVAPAASAAIEDSSNGIRSASAAGCTVVAIPNAVYPPDAAALALATTVLPSIADLEPATLGL